jgi:hypothetical protein
VMLAWMLATHLALAGIARAQEVRGTVLDSASRQPIAGAVITLLGTDGRSLGRNITDERGRYRMSIPSATVRLRFVRIGFRPVIANLHHTSAAVDTLNVVMAPLPTMLDPVSVTTNACPRSSDEGSALGLLEQARASLLNSVVSRDAHPAALKIVRFQRTMDGTSDRIVHQAVKLDSTTRSTSSFNAIRSGAEFVRSGFISDEPDGRMFYGPDADALLDDAFITGYCFRIVKGERDHPTEVGLGFVPSSRARNRVDIEGVLWVDTTSRRLRQLEFRYLGLDKTLEPAKAGGWLSFRDMPNGVVIIDRWSLRLPVIREDSLYDSRRLVYVKRSWLEVQETGGETAHAEWPSGAAWEAPFGKLRIHAVTSAQKAAVGTHVWLEDTDYRARADAKGEIVIDRLLPGPYKVVVVDSQLEPIGITLPTPIKFSAVRDSVHRAAIVVPTADDYVAALCRHDRIWKVIPRNGPQIVWMLGRVIGPDNNPIAGMSASVSKAARAEIARNNETFDGPAGTERGEVSSVRTGTDGIFALCPSSFHMGDTVRVQINHRDLRRIEFKFLLADSLTIFPLVREPRRP